MSVEEYLVKEDGYEMTFKVPDGIGHTKYYAVRDDDGWWDVYRAKLLGIDECIDRCIDRESVYSAVRRAADL